MNRELFPSEEYLLSVKLLCHIHSLLHETSVNTSDDRLVCFGLSFGLLQCQYLLYFIYVLSWVVTLGKVRLYYYRLDKVG